MLCLPGFTPVAKLAQATGDSDGCVVSSFANVPVSASRFRLGSLPSSMNLRASVGSMPSKPMTKTFCVRLRTGLPDELRLQAIETVAREAAMPRIRRARSALREAMTASYQALYSGQLTTCGNSAWT